MWKLWKDSKERPLFIWCVLAFIAFCTIEVRPPLIFSVNCPTIESILLADATKNVLSGLLGGIVSAYIFYIFIDYYPRQRREEKTMEVLNSLIASILDAYRRCSPFAHETPISHVNMLVLNEDWIDKQIPISRSNRSEYLSLKFAVETAHSKLEDFRHSLPLAVALSPEHVLRWLIITEKARLLSEQYNSLPSGDNVETVRELIKKCQPDLELRFVELLEESKVWLYPERAPSA